MVESNSNSTTECVTPTIPPRLDKRTVFTSRIKRRLLAHVWLVRIGLLAAVVAGLYLAFFLVGFLFQKEGIANYPQVLADFVLAPTEKIKSIGARTNIIILGKSGAGHAGADLTDTMMLVSVSLANPKVSVISIPRDIWIPEIRAKINSAYYWGNQKQPASPAGGPGGGLVLAKSEVEEVLGEPTQYGVVLDFNAFEKIVDVLGGIDVMVDRSFVDEKYPIAGRENDTCGGDPTFACRYETVRFEKGLTHMNGDTALKFVRSRNAQGDEGTDLAREARQEKVVTAIKTKILNPKILLQPQKALAILQVVKENLETDIGIEQAAILARIVLRADGRIGTSLIPADFLENPPISPRYDNQYVFIPKAGTWRDVHDWVKKFLGSK